MFASHGPGVGFVDENWFLAFMCPGDRLRGSEEELARAVGAVGVEEGDSDWTQEMSLVISKFSYGPSFV